MGRPSLKQRLTWKSLPLKSLPWKRLPWTSLPIKQWKPLLQTLAPYAGAGLLAGGLQFSTIGTGLDLLFYDTLTTHQSRANKGDPKVAILGISESDIQRFGYPIDDQLLTKGIQSLTQSGAAAIGIDFYRDKGIGPAPETLLKEIKTNPRLVMIFNAGEQIEAPPGTPVRQQAYNDLVVDDDGVIRRDLVNVTGQDEAFVALPMRLLETAGQDHGLRQKLSSPTFQGHWLEANSGGYRNLDSSGQQLLLRYRTPGSLAQWTLADVLDGRIKPQAIQGKIVLVGVTAPSIKDSFQTPFTRFATGQNLAVMPGVEIHAQRVAAQGAMANGEMPLRAAPGWVALAIFWFSLAAGITIGEKPKSLQQSVLILFLSEAGVFAVCSASLLLAGLWIGVVTPVTNLGLLAIGGWLRRGAKSQQHRRQIERLLGQATSPAVAASLWEQRDSLLVEGGFKGQLLPVTCLFADTVGFTSVSEKMKPDELLAWINRGMAICVPAITRRGGMVNKFTGDGFLAVFGVPTKSDPAESAKACVATALELQDELVKLNQQLDSEGLPPIRMRMGIHSDTVLAGSMGSTERLEYAVIGDGVNCASRLESVDKDRHTNHCRVLLSSTTRVLLEDTDLASLEPWGDIQVKGRQVPLEVYELTYPRG